MRCVMNYEIIEDRFQKNRLKISLLKNDKDGMPGDVASVSWRRRSLTASVGR
jgi:hypothetical protein